MPYPYRLFFISALPPSLQRQNVHWRLAHSAPEDSIPLPAAGLHTDMAQGFLGEISDEKQRVLTVQVARLSQLGSHLRWTMSASGYVHRWYGLVHTNNVPPGAVAATLCAQAAQHGY